MSKTVLDKNCSLLLTHQEAIGTIGFSSQITPKRINGKLFAPSYNTQVDTFDIRSFCAKRYRHYIIVYKQFRFNVSAAAVS